VGPGGQSDGTGPKRRRDRLQPGGQSRGSRHHDRRGCDRLKLRSGQSCCGRQDFCRSHGCGLRLTSGHDGRCCYPKARGVPNPGVRWVLSNDESRRPGAADCCGRRRQADRHHTDLDRGESRGHPGRVRPSDDDVRVGLRSRNRDRDRPSDDREGPALALV
jgi:hypothetical protein